MLKIKFFNQKKKQELENQTLASEVPSGFEPL